MSDFAGLVAEQRVVVIYRGLDAATCLRTTQVLYDAGLRMFEVTMNSDDPLPALEKIRSSFGDDLHLGAGTVLDPAQVADVAAAGATFVISPHLDEDVVAATKAAGLGSIPGALSATEIVRAVKAGADVVKVFPIKPVGAGYLKQLRGPLADVPFMATGGVDAALAGECLAAGAQAVGVGVQNLGLQAVLDGDTESLTAAAKELLAAVGR